MLLAAASTCWPGARGHLHYHHAKIPRVINTLRAASGILWCAAVALGYAPRLSSCWHMYSVQSEAQVVLYKAQPFPLCGRFVRITRLALLEYVTAVLVAWLDACMCLCAPVPLCWFFCSVWNSISVNCSSWLLQSVSAQQVHSRAGAERCTG